MKDNRFKRILGIETGIEFKACLYFFCILFFYCMVRVIGNVYEANILHMLEMILSTYVMGYLQYFLMDNFDEGETFGIRQIVCSVICTAVYTALSFVFGWFAGSIKATVIFACYMLLTYICAFFVYRFKRSMDGKALNEDLNNFRERHNGERDIDQ